MLSHLDIEQIKVCLRPETLSDSFPLEDVDAGEN